jgi:hypothetical protein
MSKKIMSTFVTLLFTCLALLGFGEFEILLPDTRARPMLSSPNAYLIVTRASVTIVPTFAHVHIFVTAS